MYHVIISPKAKKELKSISLRYRRAITQAIDDTKQDPFTGKPLTRELTGIYSYRIGIYRIIYSIKKKDKKVFILTAGHRATIYQK